MKDRLEPILAQARARVEALRSRLAEIERAATVSPAPPLFILSPGDGGVGVIAEIKRRSPSEGELRDDLDPEDMALQYQRAGAVAVSVVTEGAYFGGSLADLENVSRALGKRPGSRALPVLRKDFVLDQVQLFETRAAGAAAVLLIVRALSTQQLQDLSRQARGLDLATLVEVHTEKELDRALGVGASAVGINSRDLGSFEVDLGTAERLLPLVPGDVPAVAESGIAVRRDVERLALAGADAVLVGSAVVRSPDPERAVRDLTGVVRRPRHAGSIP
ncbi:MAG TPA: indole-3-glycerol phosphate synthase TrpC [Gemmatimonadales bacterium]|nr:indole-3-glycerol phosphate synthase TrpC [Gemmatimonadales bacterium]